MSELKATPGEWQARDVFVVSDNGDAVVTGVGKAGHDEEVRANAHLIAAAPELYEALKFMHEESLRHHPSYRMSPAEAEVMAALAKARGE